MIIPKDPTIQLRNSCKVEAEQLINPALIYQKQGKLNYGTVTLKPGHFVYKCEERDGWIVVMYPGKGEKVDCSFRTIENQCQIGWSKEKLETLNID